MHSWPMMVESMSATNSRFQRGSSDCTIISSPSMASSAHRASLPLPPKRRSAASPSSIHCRKAVCESSSRSRPSTRSINLSSSLPAAIIVSTSMSCSKPPLVLIAGPTSSGKSAVALSLAQQINGVIVNADSAQIYKDLPILSAAPTALQQREAEHRLYGIADGAKACSASDWAKLARRQIEELQGQGRTPILVGGTGLYIRTLLEGIAPVPPIDPDVRASVRHATVEANRAKLEQVDRDASRKIGPNDKTRIARALEVVLSTGRTLAEWQRYREGGIADRVDLRAMILEPPRDWLYARCNERFATMVEEGAIAEVQALIERKIGRA